MASRRRGARILATLVDFACMLPWIGVVAAAGGVLFSTGVTRTTGDVTGNVVGFITLIVPITIAAAGFDGSRRHATPGKRLLRLRVESESGGPGFFRALVRNTIKIALPWEIGHTAVFALIGETGPIPLWVAIVLGATYVIPIVSLILLLATGRPLHDRIARTSVTAVA